jgi:Phosphoinositide phospholipase C, Ca2+-dependent
VRLSRLFAFGIPFILVATPVDGAAAAPVDIRQSHLTGVGIHNTYEQAKFPYLASALDAGASLIELDVWVYANAPKWRVSHDVPIGIRDYGQRNNCSTGGLRTGRRNQVFDRCLENLRDWHAQNAGHRPIVVKVEFKAGLNGRAGAGAKELDDLIKAKLGNAVFRPADLLGGYSTLDEAAKADNWPTRAEMAGKFIFEVIPGTFERGNPFDTLHTDIEYARHVRDNPAMAQAFPAVLDAQGGDPRTRYTETSIRPWFVFFDGTATAYVGGGVNPQWYDRNHYHLVMTDAHAVAPALNAQRPTVAQARERVGHLAARHASTVSTDWYGVPEVLPLELPRG